jgi:hypothetical protein
VAEHESAVHVEENHVELIQKSHGDQ